MLYCAELQCSNIHSRINVIIGDRRYWFHFWPFVHK